MNNIIWIIKSHQTVIGYSAIETFVITWLPVHTTN